MATTDWQLAAAMQAAYPHAFNALQSLVMAMADYQKNRGKKTWFGRDKGLTAYKRFEDSLRDTLLAMVVDDAVKRNTDSRTCRQKLVEMISAFAAAFPNWQDAYSFAQVYLVEQASVAEDRIAGILGQQPSPPRAASEADALAKAAWPLATGRRLVWAPESYETLLAVAVPDNVTQVTEANYYRLLAARVQWMYEREGSPRRYVEDLMFEAGDDLGWLYTPPGRPKPLVGRRLVLRSLMLQSALYHAGLLSALPGQPVDAPDTIALVEDTDLDTWLQEVKDIINPAEWDG